ncbi:MAG: DUF302 domain-containing protein [Acidobacteriota bacterium]|nr:DUF302 domain-containing protein [Acidobacteriota bacterium]
MKQTPVAYETRTALAFDQAIEACREALGAEGFGVLTEIDIQATLKKKLDVDRDPFVILGACHPPSANRALNAAPEIAVLLPCNVTVSIEDGETVVRAMNPNGVMEMLDDPNVTDVATEVAGALQRVIRAVES